MKLSVFILLSVVGSAYAGNDWSKPCLSGVCFYDLPASADASSGTLKIWGGSDAISDITAAAGWEILDCSKDLLSQEIRLVCNGDSKCDHLYQSIGAVGKIVRLPESCGANAFARVSRAWVPKNQSIPEHIAKRLVKRNGVQPEVKALHLDTDFSSVDATQLGTISFAIRAANVPGADADIVPWPTTRVSKRGLFKKLGSFVKKAVNAVASLNEFNVDKSQSLPPLDVSKSFNLVDQKVSCPPLDGRLKIDVDAKAHAVAAVGVAVEGTIVPPKVKDFALTTSLTADLNGAININGGLTGALDSGKIKLFEVGIAGLDFPGVLTIGPSFRIDAQADAKLDINADLNVGISYHIEKASLVFPPSSKKAQDGAFQVGDTPLKLSVTPSVKASGTVSAHLIPSLNLGISALGGIADVSVFLELDASATMTLGLEAQGSASVTVNGATAARAIEGDDSSDVSRREIEMRGYGSPGHYYWNPPALAKPELPALPAVKDVPETSTGVDSKLVEGDATSTATTAASITSGTTATAVSPSATVDKASPQTEVSVSSTASSTATSEAGTSTTVPTSASTPKPKADVVATTTTSGSFGGCFEIQAGLDVNAGANANFFGIFDKNTKVSLFSRDFELFKKCFGNQTGTPKRRSLGRFSPLVARSRARESRSKLVRLAKRLACPAADVASPESLVDEVVPAASVKTL